MLDWASCRLSSTRGSSDPSYTGNRISGEVPSLLLLESDPVYAPPGGVMLEYAEWKQELSQSPLVRSMLVSRNGNKFECSRRRHCRKWYSRYFCTSKALVLVLIINALFSISLYDVTSDVLRSIIGTEFVLMRNLIVHGIALILFPVVGLVVDSHAGKHSIIRFSLWTSWICFALIGVFFSVNTFNSSINTLNKYFILPSVFILLSLSYTCFTIAIIPFGMDQLQGASHSHYRSFLYWWYWTFDIGAIISNTPKYCQNQVELGASIKAEIAIVCLSAALILDALFCHWFVIEPKSSKNSIRKFFQILCEALLKKKWHNVPSSLRHELELKQLSKLDLMKKCYGGKYETEEVDDMCTFFRVLLMLCSIGLPIFCHAGVSSY